jgi:hypothetical protein
VPGYAPRHALCVSLSAHAPCAIAASYMANEPALLAAQMVAASMVEPLPVKNAYHDGALPGLVARAAHAPLLQ